MPPKTLPAHAKRIYFAAEASAAKGTCKDAGARKDECKARVAWAAVKKTYKKVGEKWVRKSKAEIREEYLQMLATFGVTHLLPKDWKPPVERAGVSKEKAGFMRAAGYGGSQCGDCQNFRSPASCFEVEGAIDIGDYCNQYFEPALMRGDISAIYAGSVAEMIITKASKDPETGEMRWAAVASDTDKDFFEEKMSLELFNDFIQRAKSGEKAPDPFISEAWSGGLPWLGLSHYPDLDGEGILGPSTSLYVDGNRLKAKGTFRDSPLGIAGYLAVRKDRDEDVPFEKRIRISTAFLDWEHAHEIEDVDFIFQRQSLEDLCPLCAVGIRDKIYKKGHLVHLALTRIPVNERTPIWLEERSMNRKEDGISVLGEEHAGLVEFLEELDEEKRKAIEKSLASGAVVIKSEDGKEYPASLVELAILLEPIITDRVEKEVKRSMAATEIQTKTEEGAAMGEKPKKPVAVEPAVVEPVVTEPVEKPTPLDMALAKLKSAVEGAEAQTDTPVEERFKEIQPALNSLAEVVKATVVGEDLIQTQAMAEVFARVLGEQLQPITQALQLVAEKSKASPIPDASLIPGPRGFQPSITPPGGKEEKSESSITKLVRRSVGLKD